MDLSQQCQQTLVKYNVVLTVSEQKCGTERFSLFLSNIYSHMKDNLH